MRVTTVALTFLALMCASDARAQDEDATGSARTTVRPFVGAYVPTGTQRSMLQRSLLAGAQVGYTLPAPIQLVGTFGWTPSKDRVFSGARTNLYPLDAGLEFGGRHTFEASGRLAPFIGLGAGARGYRLRAASAAAEANPVEYVAPGAATRAGRVRARVEVRDYASRFHGIRAETASASTRNDLILAGALSLRL